MSEQKKDVLKVQLPGKNSHYTLYDMSTWYVVPSAEEVAQMELDSWLSEVEETEALLNLVYEEAVQ